MSLISAPDDLKQPVILKEYGAYTSQKVENFLTRFKQEEQEISSDKYAIHIDYKLALTKKESLGDILLTVNGEGSPATIIEKPAQISRTHPYRAKKTIELINKRTKETSTKINMYEFLALLDSLGIRENASYFNNESVSGVKSYSEGLVNKLVNLIDSNPQVITAAKAAKNKSAN